MPKIREIFSQAFGLSSEDQLNSLARILYHYEFDGIKRRSAPNDSNLKEILDKKTNEKELNDLLQEHIFQKIRGSRERQQIDPSNHFSDETKQQLMQDFEKIGFVAEVSPKSGKKYESVIIFGASQKGMENRLNDFLRYFLPKINENPKEIFFLVGERDAWLDSEECAKDILLEKIKELSTIQGVEKTKDMELKNEINEVYAKFSSLTEKRKGAVKYFQDKYNGIKFPTEYDIAEKIVEKIKKENKALDGVEITLINAEKKPDGSRPDTEDTLRDFYDKIKSREDGSFDKFGSILAISNQPYVNAQRIATKSAGSDLSKYDIDVVGKSSQAFSINDYVCELAGTMRRLNMVQELTASQSPSTSTKLETRRGENPGAEKLDERAREDRFNKL